MSVLDSSVTPLNFGPGVTCIVQPSGQCCPVAVGPLKGPLHLRRSKLARCPLPASAVQTTPFRSMSMPRGVYPLTGDFGLLNGGSYTSASAVCGGLGPGTTRMIWPGPPLLSPERKIAPGADTQIDPSTGLGMTP